MADDADPEREGFPEELEHLPPEERREAILAWQAARRRELEERQQRIREEISQTQELLHDTEEEIDEQVAEEQEATLRELRDEEDSLEEMLDEVRTESRAEEEERLYHGRETGYSARERLEYHVDTGLLRPGENIHTLSREPTSMQDLYRQEEERNQAYRRRQSEDQGMQMSDVYSGGSEQTRGSGEYAHSSMQRSDSNLSTNILKNLYR